VTYKTKPGDRKRYFYSNMMHWEENISEEMGKILKVTDLLKEALAMRSSNTPEFNGKLAEFIEFLEYLGEEMPLLFTKWKQRNTATHTNSNKHES
jgi:DNA-binding transcriptional regulator GbsR (MarR family)